MTKPDFLAGPARRHHVSDLDLAVGDDHPVDQEFHQGSLLLKRRLGQPLFHPPAELFDGTGQSGKLVLPVCLCLELPGPLFELLLASFQLTPAPLVFVQPHHTGEISVRQPLKLLPKARLSTS